ncbi:MAG: sigma 54-interacting transcriptional regulator [Gammaproteobacteria bacterium]|nr:sigma 54-interacting transcriptional regulator [Gammaproteobacteria bacterium]MDH4315092.1 sigma 54-interacting transcriptional regulator [Gammaproteobacteria bacterium]MDH5215873.1 sigma 54-interacting transcriptional regulator [Gammaproteobacteria bacterium]MDH5499942.1 sigma 54-interacting transcriptional regulator [Gammaproteobacteria bacterium]
MLTPVDYLWLFRRSPAMATLIGDDGRFLDVNDAFLSRLGYKRDDMLGRRPADFVTGDSAARIETEFLPMLRRTGKLERKPVDFLTRDGDIVNCLTNSIVEYNPDGKFLRTLALYMEVSDQLRSDWKYRQLYRATPAMLHTVDADACIVTVTDYWLRKMGYTREEVVGRSIRDFFSDADRKRFSSGKLREIIEAGEFTNEERQMVTHKGQVIDVVQSAISERDASGKVHRMLVASKDVTERNRVERELRQTLAENARLQGELERERDYLREEVNVRMNFGRIVGHSPALKQMLARVEAVAQTPANVLVLGESGVGKELVAHAIHAQSPRADAPLVKVNCASIPKELFESEFFGHVKGAFTGAHRDRVGRFQLADGGTLFLDEVGEIPLELQGKLLRVLQESEFERVGDDITRSVDVRVIAATNRNLEKLIVDGEFREDLFYRLSVFPIEVPPLRKRREDVIQLAQHFLEEACNDFGRKPLKLTRAQAEEILAYDWPGNVREMKNVIERAVILSKGDVLRIDLSLPRISESLAVPPTMPGGEGDVLTEVQIKALQKKNLMAALTQADWRVSGRGGAAELLGVKPTTLADRMRKFGIRKPRAA